MESIGRNDPCPCKSGRKYKKCCLEADARRNPNGLTQGSGKAVPVRAVLTELDSLSNRVCGLIDRSDFEEAEAVCYRLQIQYPDHVDGFWRLAAVYEAKGNRSAAAELYQKAADHMRHRGDFAEESIAYMIESVERMEAECGEN